MNDFLLMIGGALFAMFISGIINYGKSKWVGLTDEEIDKIYETQAWDARRSYAKAIEAKLKEKNT